MAKASLVFLLLGFSCLLLSHAVSLEQEVSHESTVHESNVDLEAAEPDWFWGIHPHPRPFPFFPHPRPFPYFHRPIPFRPGFPWPHPPIPAGWRPHWPFPQPPTPSGGAQVTAGKDAETNAVEPDWFWGFHPHPRPFPYFRPHPRFPPFIHPRPFPRRGFPWPHPPIPAGWPHWPFPQPPTPSGGAQITAGKDAKTNASPAV